MRMQGVKASKVTNQVVIYEGWTHVAPANRRPRPGGRQPLTALGACFGSSAWFQRTIEGMFRFVNAPELRVMLDFGRGVSFILELYQ